ncbi:MAG TPA: hypothetical protein VH350_05730 [Candidatus Sulfotelmatobacter sp.]|jgi:hypothetical protein|nr:hypothetical protein [Candidatus Sulfotelmatobacter sp.]
MTWTLAEYVERGVTDAMRSPTTAAFGTVFMAFFAGCLFGYRLGAETNRSLVFAALDWLLILMFLALALERGYFLVRAVHQLQNGGKTPSSS